jgi:hypothetical protein
MLSEALILLREERRDNDGGRVAETRRTKVIRIDEWQKGEQKVVPVDTDE